ncbi:MAG TPA: CxxC-x17-CxxC domain-containing protein [Candidatus Paceibacterota bacterium]
MNDFKKNFKRPGGPRQGGGFSRPSFGGSRRSGPAGEMHTASCSKCGDACEVPFKPNGKKPVFCRNCFVRDDARPSFERPRAERSFAPRESAPVDPHIDALQKELAIVHAKLDTLIQSLEGAAYASILTASAERAPAAKKAAPKKAPAAKKVAKKK